MPRWAKADPSCCAASPNDGEVPAFDPQYTQMRVVGSERMRKPFTRARVVRHVLFRDAWRRVVASRSMDRQQPDLVAAADAVDVASAVVGRGARQLISSGGPDTQQVLAYDLAQVAAQVATARAMLDYGAKGDLEARLTCAFVADMLHDLGSRLAGRNRLWGLDADPLGGVTQFLEIYRSPTFVAALAERPGPRHLDSEFEMVQDTFRSFADKEIAPIAEHVHRRNSDVPEELIAGLAEVGVFGLSVPAEYGGYSEGGDGEYIAMVIATEELSRASLGIGGSLITRPEILTRAL